MGKTLDIPSNNIIIDVIDISKNINYQEYLQTKILTLIYN